MGGGKGAGGTGTEAPPALSTCSLLDNSIPNFCVRTRDTTKKCPTLIASAWSSAAAGRCCPFPVQLRQGGRVRQAAPL